MGPVLDSFNIPLLYEQILKERRKESNEYMTDKEKELQVINESLRHDLQVSRINYQSLQEALLETESQSSTQYNYIAVLQKNFKEHEFAHFCGIILHCLLPLCTVLSYKMIYW